MSRKWMVLALIAALGLSGCAKKVDTNKSVDQIRQEAQTMSVKDLESHAKAYAQEINGKKAELDEVKAKLKTISPMELFSEKSKSIKSELETVSKDVAALTERYNVYVEQLRKAGGDLSKVQLN